MLEELFNLVKGSANESVINNPDVPNEHNNAVIAEATNTVASGLRNMVSGGGLQNVLSLFGNDQQGGGQPNGQNLLNNPMVNMMIGHLTGKLTDKFNLPGNQAGAVANNLIPGVLSNLINKTNDPNNNSFSIEKLLHSITGGQSTQVAEEQQASGNTGFNFQNLINQFSGGQNAGSGSGGLMDIVSKLANGAQSQQQQTGGGGLMDMIKGFLK